MTKEDEEIQDWCDSVAEIIADAMVDAGLVQSAEFKVAVPVVAMELFVRLICGDYPPPCKPKQLA